MGSAWSSTAPPGVESDTASNCAAHGASSSHTFSGPQAAVVRRAARLALKECLTPLERLTLKQKRAAIGDDVDALVAALGCSNMRGAGALVYMAERLAPGDSHALELAVCWMDGRLAAHFGLCAHEWRQCLFEAAAVAEVGGEPYMPYQELVDLVALVLSAFDTDPRDEARTQLDDIGADLAERLLVGIKAPAVRFAQFNAVLDAAPYLLMPLASIWDRLLFDAGSTYAPAPAPACATLPRRDAALLFAVLGPRVLASELLFQGTTRGFSMRAFETGVAEWAAMSVLLVRGHQPRSYAKWHAKHKEIDRVIAPFAGAPARAARDVVFALVVDVPWKLSARRCFGRQPVLLQLEPVFSIWPLPAESVFSVPAVGLGAGLLRPPTCGERPKGTVLFVDNSMEHGVLRHDPEPQAAPGDAFEYRFYVDQVEVLGCGSKQDVEDQHHAWAWDEADANRRRATLALAGRPAFFA